MFARAVVARQSKNLSYRELAFSKSFEQGFAYGARCAQYGRFQPSDMVVNSRNKAAPPEYPAGALRRH